MKYTISVLFPKFLITNENESNLALISIKSRDLKIIRKRLNKTGENN